MKKLIWPIVFLNSLYLSSCTDFLSVKPSKKLVIPATTSDLLSLMQDVQTMNYVYAAGLGEIGADDLFLPFETWAAVASIENRSVYTWERHPVYENYWTNSYERILNCNTVIDFLDEVVEDRHVDRASLLGVALFYRGYTYYDLVQVFSPAFEEETADVDLGIVLRLGSDINVDSERASVKEVYNQVIEDLESAVRLLPVDGGQFPTQPTKAAAYAALARCYLSMKNYGKAGSYADSCLQLQDVIVDYNEIPVKPYPFEKFNEEVVFYAQLSGYGVLNESRARIDTNLYRSYADNDLRKTLYFRENADGYHSFVGNYSQHSTVAKFSGITTAEMLVTRAESFARQGRVELAEMDLRRFIQHRYQAGHVPDISGYSLDGFIGLILDERRKELIQRGMRWPDLRRLAAEANRNVGVVRVLDGTRYELGSPDIRRFAYQLPQIVIDRSGIEQN